MAYKKTYWKNIDQLKENNQLIDKLEQNEFVEKLPLDSFDDSTFESNASRSCLLYTSPSPRDRQKSRMPSSA